jgi:hypothetical protein
MITNWRLMIMTMVMASLVLSAFAVRAEDSNSTFFGTKEYGGP